MGILHLNHAKSIKMKDYKKLLTNMTIFCPATLGEDTLV